MTLSVYNQRKHKGLVGTRDAWPSLDTLLLERTLISWCIQVEVSIAMSFLGFVGKFIDVCKT